VEGRGSLSKLNSLQPLDGGLEGKNQLKFWRAEEEKNESEPKIYAIASFFHFLLLFTAL
jgi:hypothetical protein